ncbi:MAG: hypothetical protein ABT940_08360 [Alphaproteobacteria bacterium]
MTKPEFMGQFDRLCRGFKYEATSEQAEAWFRRIGHVLAADWSEAVTTLLCAPRFPLLDPVLAALDAAMAHRKRQQIERDKKPASVLYRLVQEGQVSTQLPPILFNAIKALAGRDQARHYLSVIANNPDLEPLEREEQAAKWHKEEARLSAILTDTVPKLSEADLSALMARYGHAVAA